MTASCVGLLHAEGLLEILHCRICTADRTVHNKLLQLTVHNSVHNIPTPKNSQQFFCMQETNILSNHFSQLLYSLMMGQ